MSEVGTPIIEEPDRHDNPGTVAKGQCDLQPNEAADGPCMSAAQVLMGKLIAKADIESSDSVYLSRFGLPERQSEENKESGIPIEPAKEEHKFTDEGKARMALLTQILLKSTQNEKSEAPARSVWAPNPVVTKNEPTLEDQDQTRDPKVRVAPKSESFDNAQDILRARAIDRNKQQDGDNSIVRSKGTIYHSSGNVSSIVRANPAPVVRPQPSTDSSSRTKLQDFPTYNPDARSSSTSSTTPTPGIRTVSSGNRISHLAQPTVTPTPTNPTVIPRISPNPTSTTPKPVSNPYSTPYPNMYVHPHNNSFPTSPNVVPIAAPGSRSPYVVPPAAYTTHAPPSNIRQHVYPASPTHSQVAHPPAKGVGRSTSAPSVSSASPALLHQTASRPNAHSHLNHFAAYPTNTRPLA